MNIPKNPYLGYDVSQAARGALACVECPTPAPCQLACAHDVNIPQVLRWARSAACEGLALSRWLMDEEEVEAARIADEICDCYN